MGVTLGCCSGTEVPTLAIDGLLSKHQADAMSPTPLLIVMASSWKMLEEGVPFGDFDCAPCAAGHVLFSASRPGIADRKIAIFSRASSSAASPLAASLMVLGFGFLAFLLC